MALLSALATICASAAAEPRIIYLDSQQHEQSFDLNGLRIHGCLWQGTDLLVYGKAKVLIPTTLALMSARTEAANNAAQRAVVEFNHRYSQSQKSSHAEWTFRGAKEIYSNSSTQAFEVVWMYPEP